ncbi:hypothetical protein H0I76_16690 [Limibaculum sp. M0105]|uniref:Lipoprotein n=1 Tax=Thermohalobaculum xanthum TaxID=2753746 RepID=A0A8J7M9R1_9RHOB|nr:hypothetical protein [Thermohalobaculum xanthum]MBK0400840.1 hypothetical protein [Thermohalobaculum xanthum]
MRKPIVAALAAASVLLAGCEQGIPPEALAISQVSVEKRQLQTRYFETEDESLLLNASVAVLQDLGFTLEESETDLGVLLATKDRDATEAGQIAGAILLGVLTGVYVPTDRNQKIRVSVVTRPLDDGRGRTAVRATFQRLVWDTQGNLSKIEGLNEPELYQGFFEKLAQSVFLEAQEI